MLKHNGCVAGSASSPRTNCGSTRKTASATEVALIGVVLTFAGWLLLHGYAPHTAAMMPLVLVVVVVCAVRLDTAATRPTLLRLLGAAPAQVTP